MDWSEVFAWFILIPAAAMIVVTVAIAVFGACYTTVWHIGYWVGWW